MLRTSSVARRDTIVPSLRCVSTIIGRRSMSHAQQTSDRLSQTSRHVNAAMNLGPETQLTDKKAVRKEINTVLSTLTTANIEKQSASASKLMLSLSQYKNARSISIFLSMPSKEIQSRHVLEHALASGKQVFVPYIYKPRPSQAVADLPASIMDKLQLASLEDFGSLKPDKWGIPSIAKDSVANRANAFGSTGVSNGCSPEEDSQGLDVILMPCMAFDTEMNRLGHGKGYYDNFLTRYCSGRDANGQPRKKPYLIGYALAEQLLPLPYRLPTEAHDWKVDAVIVGNAEGDATLISPPSSS